MIGFFLIGLVFKRIFIEFFDSNLVFKFILGVMVEDM